MKLTTTLNKIKKYRPCAEGWEKAVSYFGDLDQEISLREIIKSNGIQDALWCLRVWPEYDCYWRLLAVRYAREVETLMTDPASLNALDVAECYACGIATDDNLISAWDAAGAAARDVAWSAAWDAARAAAWSAASAACAAGAAAGAAARAACAAGAARAACAAGAAWDAACAAWDAAWDAAREKQKQFLLETISEIEGV